MIDPRLRAKILAYNRRLQVNREKAALLEQVRALTGKLSGQPGISELLEFLVALRALLQ